MRVHTLNPGPEPMVPRLRTEVLDENSMKQLVILV
jgi:hypothetical protein